MIYDLVGFVLQFAVLVFAAYLGTMLALGQFHRQTTGEPGETMALSHRLTPRFMRPNHEQYLSPADDQNASASAAGPTTSEESAEDDSNHDATANAENDTDR
ncbi:uncharacterized protein Nmag_3283 [Natrialba magadii ATCC 43099]|uniref:Uncharacterized protein n=1 Tax=Natrialba magadii (strain ATCC 43099 / DSM 3394 / CCM 3739 / CIP 104546 / IAM 13178 / JCM 8861 / NBRC 102185 / NCIMB 2190 / MS3) TaxID=547559 RepID=D3SSI8_NATMM|nr:hypothetical protein [Natrialba magadii]ADD06833.1 uncharacterized protein Nmag_3283 [Natrialba magadii ATCC 43099]ELY28240.1 hypothetical protein C500_13821 [Natrialba magadii ATCC 43099]